MLFLPGAYSRAAVTNWGNGATVNLTIAVDGTYFVAVTTNVSGASYSLAVSAVSSGGSGALALPASDIGGTLISAGAPVASIIDSNTKSRDVFAIALHRGDSVAFNVTSKSSVALEVANR